MLWALASFVLVLSVAAALVTTSVNVLLYDPDYYAEGQVRYAVGRTTEYPLEALRPVNQAIVRFFRTPGISLPGALGEAGADRSVFNAREIGHMEDVREIVRLVGQVQVVSLVLVAALAVGRLLAYGPAGLVWLANRLLLGALLTVGAVGALGALALVDFGSLFLRFHLLSFDNDLWQLDPRRDNLIRFFPFPFWFDATVSVALRSVFSALVVAALALGTRRLAGRMV
jgi:integral membrane protein (TIGR01906 family)